MTGGVPIIDLDVAPPRADAAPRSLRPRLAAARPALLAGVVALVLASLGAAAPPAARLIPMLSAGGTAAAAFALGPDSLYIAQFGANPSSESVVRAYRLADGSERWSGGFPQNVQNLVLDPVAHVLMARSGTDPRVVFLDSDTGDTLWRRDQPNSTVVSLARGNVLVREDVSATRTSLRLLDARTGREQWSQAVDPTAELGPDDLYDDAPTRIIAVGSTGEITVLNYADGAVLSQGRLNVRLPGQVDPFFQNDFVAVSTVGDRLYVSRRTGGHATMTAYSTVPLSKLWTIAGGPVGRVVDCGVVLCVADTRWVSGVDPATGEARWAEPAWSTAFRYDATRLFAYDQQEMPESALLDAATGRLIRRLGHTFRLGDLMLKSDDKVPGRTWVGAVDPADGALHAVGSVNTAVPFGCSVRDRYLACPTSSGPTTVWKVP